MRRKRYNIKLHEGCYSQEITTIMTNANLRAEHTLSLITKTSYHLCNPKKGEKNG